MRYLVEIAVGHSDYADAIKIRGRAHPFRDMTDEPLPALVAGRVVRVIEQNGASTVKDTEKPPYAVPTMASIRAQPKNGLTVVSTFSGCGGSCLGFEMAGYTVLYANEFVEAARDTYALNHNGVFLDGRDIRTVTAEDILDKIGKQRGEIDVLEGSPPCASFSTAGKRAKDWGKVKKYCIGPETPILYADLTWRRADEAVEGDQIIAFDEEPVNGGKRTFRPATIEGADRLTRPSLRITTDSGADVICSTDHRWLVLQGNNLRWKKANHLSEGDVLLSLGRRWEQDRSYEAGYVAGIFDGEGCVSRSKGGHATRLLTFAQRPGGVLDRTLTKLDEHGIYYGVYPHECGMKSVNINGGVPEKLRTLGVFRPERLIEKAALLYDGVSIGSTIKTRVVRIKDVGDQPVIAISTSAKTFIADGLLSHNSDVEQRTDDLFFEYIRLIDGLRPRVFVAENVSGLVKGVAKGYFIEIMQAMKATGYRVEARMLDAQWLGVPQARQRIIFIGVREDQDFTPVYPAPLPYRYSVRDAIDDLVRTPVKVMEGHAAHFDRKGKPFDVEEPIPTIISGIENGAHGYNQFTVIHDTSGLYGAGDITDRPAPAITVGVNSVNSLHFKVHDGAVFDEETGQDISIDRYAIGPEWEQLAKGEVSEKYLNLIRSHDNKPSPCVTATGGLVAAAGPTHYGEPRKFTIAEVRRLCAFPDDFQLTGSYAQQWERMGRAVPPLMMRAVADALKPKLLGTED